MAAIITTGDVPLGLRMAMGDAEQSGVRAALSARRDGLFKGMSYAEVVVKLRANLAETQGTLEP
jgi:hypothetical protein